MAERVLSTRELNRAVLARQQLLRRTSAPPERVLEGVAGLQTQYAPSGYVGLWSRVEDFETATLTAALLQRRVVQAWVMRATIHMVSAADYWPLTAAVRSARRRLWRPPDGVDMAVVAAAARAHLQDGPLSQSDLVSRLTDDGWPKQVWAGLQLWLDLVRVPPAGTWERPRAGVYGLADDWLGPAPDDDVEAGQDRLVRRYLGGFGPASPRDFGSFAGWNVSETRAALARLELRRFRDESGGELVDLPGAPLPDAETPAPVRFLGQWEAVLLVHARRSAVLPEAYRTRVFATRMPQSVPTFLVDGQVAGTWRAVDGRVRVTPFGHLSARATRETADEAERLAVLYAASAGDRVRGPAGGGARGTA